MASLNWAARWLGCCSATDRRKPGTFRGPAGPVPGFDVPIAGAGRAGKQPGAADPSRPRLSVAGPRRYGYAAERPGLIILKRICNSAGSDQTPDEVVPHGNVVRVARWVGPPPPPVYPTVQPCAVQHQTEWAGGTLGPMLPPEFFEAGTSCRLHSGVSSLSRSGYWRS